MKFVMTIIFLNSLIFSFLFFEKFKQPDISNIPIHISSQWARSLDTISLNINYQFNTSALPESIRIDKESIIIYTIITDGQKVKESLPTAEW